MDEKVRALIGMGAAFASGAHLAFKEHVKNAKGHGATMEELDEVLAIARSVKLSGSMEMDSFAEATTKWSPKTDLRIITPSGSNCDCGPEGCC